MRPVVAKLPIDAPRERVHEFLLDLSARPSFTDHFLDDYRMLRVEPIGVGAGARFRVTGTDGWMDSVISEVDAPFRITEHGHSGRLNRVPTFTIWETVEQPGPGGCELKVVFWTEPSSAIEKMRERPLRRKLGKGFKRAAERLKQLIEGEGVVERVEIAGESRLGI